MQLTSWDRLVLNLTGKLPKKTQKKVDLEVERQDREFRARLAALHAEKIKRAQAAEKKAKVEEKPAPKAKAKPAAKPAAKAPAKAAPKKAAPKKKS